MPKIFYQREDLKVRDMKNVLASYGIKCSSISLKESANVDVYDLKLELGVRSSKVSRSLVDIGMSLMSHTTPIGTPITSSGVYRLNIQKREIESSPIERDVFDLKNYEDMVSPILIGRNINSDKFIFDLNRAPNILVGGIPGAGKSMLLHSIILSSVINKSDIYLCDPKMVEFSSYSELKEVKGTCYDVAGFKGLIEMLVSKMNSRFEKLSKASVRNIGEYNLMQSNRGLFFSKKLMKPIVVVVDEWADIYLQDKKVENLLCMLAQKGRAAGISIVLATQRPSAKIISGLIKASFPGRIAMRTASAIDSRVVIDQNGAEKLVDLGAGLFKDSYSFNPIQFRTPYISHNSIKNILEKS